MSHEAQLVRCYLGVGGNISNVLGNPSEHIEQAARTLAASPDIANVRLSSLYQSIPLGPQDQPDFTNAVIEIDTLLTPHALLKLCQTLENEAQRVRQRHWGERSLDVDILLYNDVQIETDVLTIPHRGLLERNFVLIPLAELQPDIIIGGKPISQWPLSQDWTGLQRLL